MSNTRPSLTMEIFVELSRQEPFRTGVLFVLGFLTTPISLAVLCALNAILLLTHLPFVHLGLTAATAISMVFSFYFVVGYIVWYKRESLTA